MPHPDYPPKTVTSVEVELRPVAGGGLFLIYAVDPAHGLRLQYLASQRTDGLWHSTCFELFLKGDGPAYREFNFAPLMAWNAYAFADWRRGMTEVELDRRAEPHIVDLRGDDRRGRFPVHYELDVILPREALGDAGPRVSLTAVIEETDGTKSYWALAHPSGDADFHNAACFTLELPPATAA